MTRVRNDEGKVVQVRNSYQGFSGSGWVGDRLAPCWLKVVEGVQAMRLLWCGVVRCGALAITNE